MDREDTTTAAVCGVFHREPHNAGLLACKLPAGHGGAHAVYYGQRGGGFAWADHLATTVSDGRPPGWPCADCGVDTFAIGEWYCVSDQLWAAVGMECEGFLCIGCLERRLGREMDSADFVQAMLVDESSDRLQDRLRRPHRKETRTGRNDPCRCGSGRKFKHCHGRTT
jgi:SEC-C motif